MWGARYRCTNSYWIPLCSYWPNVFWLQYVNLRGSSFSRMVLEDDLSSELPKGWQAHFQELYSSLTSALVPFFPLRSCPFHFVSPSPSFSLSPCFHLLLIPSLFLPSPFLPSFFLSVPCSALCRALSGSAFLQGMKAVAVIPWRQQGLRGRADKVGSHRLTQNFLLEGWKQPCIRRMYGLPFYSPLLCLFCVSTSMPCDLLAWLVSQCSCSLSVYTPCFSHLHPETNVIPERKRSLLVFDNVFSRF